MPIAGEELNSFAVYNLLSNLAIAGCYLFYYTVFPFILALTVNVKTTLNGVMDIYLKFRDSKTSISVSPIHPLKFPFIIV